MKAVELLNKIDEAKASFLYKKVNSLADDLDKAMDAEDDKAMESAEIGIAKLIKAELDALSSIVSPDIEETLSRASNELDKRIKELK